MAVNGLDAAAARAVADTIRGEGGLADAFVADVTDQRQVTDLVAAVANSASR